MRQAYDYWQDQPDNYQQGRDPAEAGLPHCLVASSQGDGSKNTPVSLPPLRGGRDGGTPGHLEPLRTTFRSSRGLAAPFRTPFDSFLQGRTFRTIGLVKALDLTHQRSSGPLSLGERILDTLEHHSRSLTRLPLPKMLQNASASLFRLSTADAPLHIYSGGHAACPCIGLDSAILGTLPLLYRPL